MPYSELVYFNGAHFSHVVTWLEHKRLQNAQKKWQKHVVGRQVGRHIFL